MDQELAKTKNVMNYMKSLEKEWGFGKTLKDQKNFKEKLKEKHEISELLLLKDRFETQLETNKDSSFIYNFIVTVFITALTLFCTAMVCYFTVSAQVMNSKINTKVDMTTSDENFKKKSLIEQEELLATEIYSPVKKELNDLLLGGFFSYIFYGIVIVLIGLILFLFWYRYKIKRARYYLMVITESISDIKD
ncbi:hypothetical protein EAI05_00085 [Bacillus subtilis]|uniref:hypothetical protein n=1 Tax=Bacillus subtilis TaxID=1423 RepID=UPI000F078CE4|nr:hypothetical protein [Bacillus subtilis]MCV2515331.1 hypothetical protein [Bacillus subtilis]RNA74199.1 hypothetical protein EAI05_00085 [Bacillus subtilis]